MNNGFFGIPKKKLAGLSGPASSVDDSIVLFDGVTGKKIKGSGKTHSTDGTFASDSDSLIPTEKAVKTYADAIRFSRLIGYTGSVASSNTTTEEILYQVLIPGGTLEVGDKIVIDWAYKKTVGAGNITIRSNLNSVNTAGGAGRTAYFLLVFAGTSLQQQMSRVIFTGAATQTGTAALGTGFGQLGGDVSSGTLNIANNIYVQITSEKVTGTDTSFLRWASVEIQKYIP